MAKIPRGTMTDGNQTGYETDFEKYGGRVLAVFGGAILCIAALMLYFAYVRNNLEAVSSLMQVVGLFLFPVTAVTLGVLFVDALLKKHRRAQQ